MSGPSGVQGRIRLRLQSLGYWKDGRPDVSRFCREKGYQSQSVYEWLKGRVPRAESLIRLGSDLAASPAWLLFGEDLPEGWIGAEVRQLIRPYGFSGPFPAGDPQGPQPAESRIRRPG
jgi:hypothetical protein